MKFKNNANTLENDFDVKKTINETVTEETIQEEKTKDIRKTMSDIGDYIFIAFTVVFLYLTIFVVSVSSVTGNSMLGSLEDGDYLVSINDTSNLDYEDIVSFKHTDEKNLVKRVIGLEGDTIVFDGHDIYRNGELLDEPYLQLESKTKFKGEVTLEEGEVWVMGDNRDNSTDSRQIGAIQKDQVFGIAKFRIFPFSKIGTIK